jgi:hypothetical protein
MQLHPHTDAMLRCATVDMDQWLRPGLVFTMKCIQEKYPLWTSVEFTDDDGESMDGPYLLMEFVKRVRKDGNAGNILLVVSADVHEDFQRLVPLFESLHIFISRYGHGMISDFHWVHQSYLTLTMSVKRDPRYRYWVRDSSIERIPKRTRLESSWISQEQRDRIADLPAKWKLATDRVVRAETVILLSYRLPICRDIARYIVSFVHVSWKHKPALSRCN